MRKNAVGLFVLILLFAGFSAAGIFFGEKFPFSKMEPKLTAHDGEESYAPHKALYDFRLVSADSSAGISGIRGQMFYTQDDACDAWTSEHRFRTQYQYPEQRPVMETSTYSAWEAKDQSLFHFRSERSENGMLTNETRGDLKRSDDGTAVAVYAKPEDTTYDLPAGYMLPTKQTNEVIRHARENKAFFNTVMFDGTDADGPIEVTTFIGKKLTAAEISALAENKPQVNKALLTEGWHVHMAVFPLKDKDAMVPVYEMDMVLHANGVVSHVIIDYKNFKVEQSIEALEALPAKSCS